MLKVRLSTGENGTVRLLKGLLSGEAATPSARVNGILSPTFTFDALLDAALSFMILNLFLKK